MRAILRLDDKEFYKTLAAIAIPIALQNLINFGVNMMDTVMLGRVGEIQLSAASIANQLSFMFMVLSQGVASGTSVITSQYWGKGEHDKVRAAISIMYRLVGSVAIIFFLISQFFPEQVVKIFIANDPAVVSEAVDYLKIVGFSYLFSGITNSSIGIFRSIGTVKISVVVYSISLVTNTILNYCLIFGNFGFPELGIEGAAIATLVSRVIETIVIITFMLKYEKKLQFKLSYLKIFDKSLIPLFMQFALVVVMNEMLWTTGNAIVNIIIARMGREVVAANSISSVLFQLAGIAMFGIAAAASSTTGQTIGKGDYTLALERAKAFNVMAFLLGIFGAMAILLIRTPVISFYNISELAKDYAFQITSVSSFIVVFQAVAIILMMGVLRGGGDTKYVTVMDVIIMWIIAIPLGYVAGLVLGLPVPLVYLLLKCDEIIKALFASVRVFRGKWIKDVTR